MPNLVTVLPFSVPGSNLPTVAAADMRRLSDVEIGAYDHWIFNGGASSLVGKSAGKVLTVQSTAPTYSSDWLSISLNQGAGLLTNLGEVSGQADTLAMVCKIATVPTAAIVLGGTLAPSSEPAPQGGGSVFISTGDKLYLSNRGTSQNGTDTTDTLSAATWAFICLSRNMSASGAVRFLKGGSTVREYLANFSAYVPAPSPRKISLGGAYYNNQAGNTLSIFEAVLYNRALTSQEMLDLYNRAKSRAAKVGITI